MRRLILCLTALLLLSGVILPPFALSEDTTTEEDVIVEPTLSEDANPYDADHPELLEDDQLIAHSAILMEVDSGEIIFEKSADDIMYPASTTKIMTVLLGLMMGDINETVTVSDTAMNIPADSSTMGLKAGEEINFLDLCYGTMLVSANEGANVIAETVSGSIDNFVQLMNNAAQVFGCTNTHFANPHGYHDDNHYTTAHDMALIAREAMKNETFRQIVSATTYQLPRTNLQRARTITNKASILQPGTEEKPNKYYYPYATGIKTGSHSKAAYCFVGSASKDGVDLISVVLYTSNRGRWTDTIKLMNYGFAQYISVTPIDLYNMNPISIETTNYSLSDTDMGKLSLTCVSANNNDTTSITATQSEVDAMAANLRDTVLIEYTRDFEAPIAAGEVMATMTYFPQDKDPVEYNLVADRSIAKRENAPKTLEEIVAETEADPNPFPPLTLEMALYLLLPILALVLLFHFLRKLFRRRRVRNARVPKPKSRYLK